MSFQVTALLVRSAHLEMSCEPQYVFGAGCVPVPHDRNQVGMHAHVLADANANGHFVAA